MNAGIKYLVVALLALTLMPGIPLKTRVAKECAVLLDPLNKKQKGHSIEKKHVNGSHSENLTLARKLKSKCTALAIVSVPNLEINQHFRFASYYLLPDEKSNTLISCLFYLERGPPLI